MNEITDWVRAAGRGDRSAYDALFPRVYDTLRRMAGARMRAERREHTLTPTALVNELYIKLLGEERCPWQNRAQFLAVAARAMRQILVDHAIRRKADKRGGTRVRVTLDDALVERGEPSLDVLALEEALTRLERENQRRAQVVVCRFFGGLDIAETASALAISEATVKRDWTVARAWLNRELTGRSVDSG